MNNSQKPISILEIICFGLGLALSIATQAWIISTLGWPAWLIFIFAICAYSIYDLRRRGLISGKLVWQDIR